MCRYAGHRRVAANIVVSDESTFSEDEEPGYGPEDFRMLFLGEPDETAEQAGARAEVAREVFAELMDKGVDDEITRLDAAYAAWLLCAASLQQDAHRESARAVRRVEAAA